MERGEPRTRKQATIDILLGSAEVAAGGLIAYNLMRVPKLRNSPLGSVAIGTATYLVVSGVGRIANYNVDEEKQKLLSQYQFKNL